MRDIKGRGRRESQCGIYAAPRRRLKFFFFMLLQCSSVIMKTDNVTMYQWRKWRMGRYFSCRWRRRTSFGRRVWRRQRPSWDPWEAIQWILEFALKKPTFCLKRPIAFMISVRSLKSCKKCVLKYHKIIII